VINTYASSYVIYITSRYSPNAFRCSPTRSSGRPVQLQILWNTSNDHKHSHVSRSPCCMQNTQLLIIIIV